MKLTQVILFHLKRIIKTPILFSMMVIMPAVVTALFVFVLGNDDSNAQSQVVLVTDQAQEKTIQSGLEEVSVKLRSVSTVDEGLELLDKGEAALVYVLPDGFLDYEAADDQHVPTVYSRDGQTTDQLVDQALLTLQSETFTTHLLQADDVLAAGETYSPPRSAVSKIVEESSQNSENHMQLLFATVMIVTYMIMNGSYFASDLASFKTENVLRRVVMTANNSFKITFSFLAAYGIFSFLSNSLLLGISAFISGATLMEFLRMLLIIGVATLFSLSFGLALFRAVKQPQLCASLGMLIAMVMLALAFMPILFDNQEWLTYLGYLSPLSWLIKGLQDQTMLLPGLLIVLLMSSVLFTAGSYRLERYVNRAN